MNADVMAIQKALNNMGYNPIVRDGKFGPQTRGLVEEWVANGGKPRVATAPAVAAGAPRFEPVTRAQATATFGQPGSAAATRGRCVLPFRFPLAWDRAQQISAFACHEQLADVMTWVFAEAARHYGEAEFRRLGLDQFGGCFNHRAVRGGTAVSIHSYGAAVDTDPVNNGLNTPTAQARLARPEYAPWWAIVEATGARALGKRINRDWMHWSYVQE
jgi:hypothetical protein